MKQNVTDHDIQALIDGELDAERTKDLTTKISRDATLYARFKQLKSQNNLIIRWYNTSQKNRKD